MEADLGSAIIILAAYLLGSIPSGLLAARIVAGQDIRTLGSGNIGATNVGRVLGTKWGIAILLADALKGVLAVWLLPQLLPAGSTKLLAQLPRICGIAAAVGHMFPCWLKFRGGKGVATSMGAAVLLAPYATLAAAVVFIVAFVATRIVSLGSVLGALCFAAFGCVRAATGSEAPWSLAAFSVIVPLLIIVRHRSNIGRIMRGEEPRYRSAPAEKK